MKHLVIGSKGEVGSAILSILINTVKEVYAQDLDLDHDLEIKVDVIHICFPYSDNFNEQILNYVTRFGVFDAYIVIHSTVLPFTTVNLSKIINNVIYSPVRGNHPNLYTDMLKYTKYFASAFPEALGVIVRVFQLAGLKTKIVSDDSSLEFAKLYSTLMFGISLIITQEVYGTKKTYGLDPAIIMDFVNDTGKYTNDRKIYPYIEKIGGHCVIENAKLFEPFSTIAVFMVRFNKLFGNEYPDKGYKLKEEN